MRKILICGALLLFAGRAEASLSVVQAANHQATSATASTITVTTTAGNLLVINCYEGVNNTSTATISDSTGGSNTWTQAGGYVSADTSSRMAMFYAANSAAVTSITCTWSGSLSATIPAVMYEISGAATSSPLDSNASNPATSTGSGTATSLTSGSLSTSNANDILLYGVGVGSNTSGWAASGAFAIQSGGSISSGRMAMSFDIVSSTQSNLTTSISWTTTATHRTGMFAAFMAAGGGTSPAGMNKRQRLEQMDPSRR